MPNSKRIIYLSDAQRQELFTNDTITVDGVTINYDENDIYVTPQAEPVTDVRVNGTSVSSGGVANVPVASGSVPGVVKISDDGTYGIRFVPNSTTVGIKGAIGTEIKNGTTGNKPITPMIQNESTFYGLAKAAGHDEKDSTESLGTYTPGAKAAIQQMLGISNLLAPTETTTASKAYSIGEVFTSNGKLYKATAAIAAADAIVTQDAGETVSGSNAAEVKVSEYAVRDVQVDGTSVLQDGVANVPIVESRNQLGLIKIGSTDYGINIASGGEIRIYPAQYTHIQNGTDVYDPITPGRQHRSVFYGLAKAAGDTTQSASSNAVGVYTNEAKIAIKNMLDIQSASISITISGTTPTIIAQSNARYICSEISTLDFTPCASGICEVIFTSGSTAAVLTVPNTVKFPEWFDATSLDVNTIYDISIVDGVYAAVMTWAV